ncbi:pseudouridine synthase [Aquincola sp. J276]|uniref:pseudouridine synthase n=1 Tax=Aquincola sp. J276 TaxID=2898432 RepID=UPI002151F7B8|nr:pseudouridine synthase [Aquincola sp. J276]MCR5863841.1 pseudouridine synthase [Aquincola sp. J276]
MTRPRVAWAPPMRDGVSPSRVAVSGGPWPGVLAFLQARLPAVADWPQRLARGDVLDLQGRPLQPGDACRPGAVYWYWRSLPPEPRVPFEIELLHQDDDLVAVDKPHFLPVAPSGRWLQETVLVRLKRLLGIDTLVPMHRLDRETAGVLLFTVRPGVRDAYQAVLRERRAHKVYEAIAPWRPGLQLPCEVASRLQERPGDAFMQMEEVPGESNARSRVELVTRLGAPPPGAAEPGVAEIALYRLQPHTGRRHQLRVHMAALGLPLLGDRIYPRLWPAETADAPPDYRWPLQLLAREIRFTDPLSGRERCFTSRRQLAVSAGGCAESPT